MGGWWKWLALAGCLLVVAYAVESRVSAEPAPYPRAPIVLDPVREQDQQPRSPRRPRPPQDDPNQGGPRSGGPVGETAPESSTIPKSPTTVNPTPDEIPISPEPRAPLPATGDDDDTEDDSDDSDDSGPDNDDNDDDYEEDGDDDGEDDE